MEETKEPSFFFKDVQSKKKEEWRFKKEALIEENRRLKERFF